MEADASTRAYGVVGLDVDKDEEAYLSFWDYEGHELYKLDFEPQPWASKGFSFAGIVCDKPVINKVDVILGKDKFDVCVDDVFYGEPTYPWKK
jgi:hypothetical protein